MGIFSRKTIKEEIKKKLTLLNTKYEGDNPISFELSMKNGEYTLNPYIEIFDSKDESYISFKINIRKCEEPLLNTYERIKIFNNKSKYLLAKLTFDNILLLECNQIVVPDNTQFILNNIIESVFSLEDEIDLL